MNTRKEYYKEYYQKNKDKYKKEHKIIYYCKVCDKEFINITRHKQTGIHQCLFKISQVGLELDTDTTDGLDAKSFYEKLRIVRIPSKLKVLPVPELSSE